MRRLLPLALALALAVPGAAPAKGPSGALRICGSSGCLILGRHVRHGVWELLADTTQGRATGPARPGPYYELAILALDERGRPQSAFPSARFYYAPRSKRIRTSATVDPRDGVWRTLDAPPPALVAAVRRLRPFPAPILVRVEVDGRPAADPQSYLRLFRVQAPRRPISDPAGLYPTDRSTSDTSALVRYWQRVGRYWLPVSATSRRPGPWGDDATFLWIARRLPLVKRDGEIVRVPAELAARVRRAQSLR
jgi:hypothetical protein